MTQRETIISFAFDTFRAQHKVIKLIWKRLSKKLNLACPAWLKERKGKGTLGFSFNFVSGNQLCVLFDKEK